MTSRLRMIGRASIVTFLSIALIRVPVSAGPVCSCDDIAQIQYRIAEDQAAIDAYNRYLELPPAQGPNTKRAYNDMQRYVQNAMGHPDTTLASVFPPGELARTGYFDGKCQTILPKYDIPPTPCMAHAIDVHEAIHRKACEDAWDKPIVGKRALLLITKLNEEIDAYTAEKTFLEVEKARQLCNCDYYALKLEMTATMDFSNAVSHQHQDWTLKRPDEKPFVNIPLTIEDGAVSGKGSGVVHMLLTDEAAVHPCNATSNAQLTAGRTVSTETMPTDYALSGTMAREFSPTLTATTNEISGESACSNQTGVYPPVAVSQPVHASRDTTLRFTKLDEVFEPPTPTQSSGTEVHFKAALILNETWKDRKASNGRGSTVVEALKVIGLCDCPNGPASH